MLSRVANSIYWMNRYLERAENVARIIAVNQHLILDLGLAPENAQWTPVVITSGDEEDFTKRYKKATADNVIWFLTFDGDNPNSILSCIESARENARTVRDAISSEMWENLNDLYHTAQKLSRKRRLDNLDEFCTYIRRSSHLFVGLCEDTMSHNEALHFGRMGKMLERADKTSRILDVKYYSLLPSGEYVDSPQDAVEWGAVLKSVNGFDMYRKLFHRVNYKHVAGFLIFNAQFPRSMMHAMNTATFSLRAIMRDRADVVPAQLEMEKLRNTLLATSSEAVLADGLHEFIDKFQLHLNAVDDTIFQSFFAVR